MFEAGRPSVEYTRRYGRLAFDPSTTEKLQLAANDGDDRIRGGHGLADLIAGRGPAIVPAATSPLSPRRARRRETRCRRPRTTSRPVAGAPSRGPRWSRSRLARPRSPPARARGAGRG